MRPRAGRKDSACAETMVPNSQRRWSLTHSGRAQQERLLPGALRLAWMSAGGALRSHRGAGWQGALPARPPSPREANRTPAPTLPADATVPCPLLSRWPEHGPGPCSTSKVAGRVQPWPGGRGPELPMSGRVPTPGPGPRVHRLAQRRELGPTASSHFRSPAGSGSATGGKSRGETSPRPPEDTRAGLVPGSLTIAD